MKTLFLIVFLTPFIQCFPQVTDSTIPPARFTTTITLTTKGISTIPNLTLGKPAVLFDLAMGRRITFEPQFRFSLEGKPWTFIFWWRYNLINHDNFRIGTGVHPAFSFKTVTDSLGETMQVVRYLAGDLSPTYFITKNISVGLYYLYSHGLDKQTTNNTHLISLRTGISIPLTKTLSLRLNPQVYYLKMEEDDGFYFYSIATAVKRNFPLSVSVLINKTINTSIPAKDTFLWNASLIYTFSREYIRKP